MNRFSRREFHTPEYYTMSSEQLLQAGENMRENFREIGTECAVVLDKAEYLQLTSSKIALAKHMVQLADGFARDLQNMMSRANEKDAYIKKLLELRENLQSLRQIYNTNFGSR